MADFARSLSSSPAFDDSGQSPAQLLRPYWRVTLAAFLGWFLDAFDQVALLLCLPDMGKSLGVSLTAMGLIITAQSVGRVLGNTGWGWLADRYGRKLTFMIGVVWFAAFSGATAVASSYLLMVAIQFMFGVGFGGEWTASAALLMESVPPRARTLASSLMMAGYECGFFAAAAAQAVVLPHFGWRALFVLGIVPALLAIFIRIGVPESPVWLAAQKNPRAKAARPKGGMFRLDGAAVQAIVFMAVLQFQNAALYTFYPTLLRTTHGLTPGQVFPMVAAYCIGSLIGKPLCGALATRFGERPVIYTYFLITLAAIIPFVTVHSFPLMFSTAFIIGAFGNSIWALVPHFLAQRFPSATRSLGMGTSYAAAAMGQGLSGFFIPWFATMYSLGYSMEISVFVGTAIVAAVLAYRPPVLPGEHMEGEVTH
ncbi:sugar transport protein [Neoasaia chiangmaiensis NBRC 101099]|uniref:Sugar transporter n=1 Tax=Neoasaia chiangmaiensis TaxID=320497 RepID=A0A1U9KPU4_9PROT|nr:MFS transporter [Neoasaia chiangmaiensis]AQS87785.1 sugar transporter [Neoasaia chiangmaiensis]GBR41560.1 sugar transport protein [Neoasaia chiangmaiensis NBRC 101099]GEN14390.1 MFS transporter [Neoasaia chiangmaiensis]